MVRVKVLRAQMGEGMSAVVRTLYAARINLQGRITEFVPLESKAAAFTPAEAEQIARYYLRHEKPGKIVYEEVPLAPAG